MSFQPIRFSTASGDTDFIKILRKRVSEYFKTNNISKYGDSRMIIKTVFMVALYFIPFGFIVSGLITNPWLFYAAWIIMGVGLAGIGLSVMHDANHGAYSKSKRTNTIVGHVLNVVGGHALTWKIQHNVLHHSYTNIDGMDEDITTIKFLRFSPHTKRIKLHRLQFIYAWFFYGIMTIFWVTAKDFSQVIRFKKMGLINKKHALSKMIAELVLWKVVYYAYVLVLPLILLPVSPWFIILCFLSMHFTAGLILSGVFQSAHVMPDCEFPLPDEKRNIENDWAVHQLRTTANFANSSTILSWYVGGLNYQIEHHLFPNICHVHYKAISKIVKKTAEEFNLPYHTQKNFFDAVWNHTKMLKNLGKYDTLPVKA